MDLKGVGVGRHERPVQDVRAGYLGFHIFHILQ